VHPLAIGSFLGRVVFVAGFDGKGEDGAVFLENGFGAGPTDPVAFAAGTTFQVVPRAAEMGPPSEAAVVGPDVVWARAFGGTWEWTPAGWRHLDADVRLPRPHELAARPAVLTDLLRKRFWCLRPRAADGFGAASVASFPLHVVASAACPDPSGGGLWVWDQKASPPDMDYVRFASPHHVADNRPNTTHPARFRVARVNHRQADGTLHTPRARNGALLLPTGAEFLLGRGGFWAETDRSALGVASYVELTPGALSVEAAWLAVRLEADKPQRLVAIDVEEGNPAGRPTRITVEELGPTAPTGSEVALVPDSTGSVWFAVREEAGWRLRKVIPGLPERGPSLASPGLTEAPRYLLLSSPQRWLGDGFLLTDTGGCRVAHADRIGAEGGRLGLFRPEVKPWVELWPENPRAPRGAAEYDVVTSRRWGLADGDVRVVVLRRAGAGEEAEAFTVEPTAVSPGLKADPAARRLDAGPLRGFRPRLWFPGGDDYVVGEAPDGRPGAADLLVIPTDGLSSVGSASWLKTFAHGVSPRFGARLSCASLNRPGGQEADTLAVAGGNAVAFLELSSLTNPPVLIPTNLEVYQGGRLSHDYDVRAELPTRPVPTTVDRLVIRVAPNYGDWWRPDWARVSLRDVARSDAVERFPLAVGVPQSTVQVPVSPGLRRELSVVTDQWPSAVPFDLRHLVIDVAPAPTGPGLLWSLLALPASLVVVVVGVAASSEFYHQLLVAVGYRWEFAEEGAQVVVFLQQTGAAEVALRQSGDATSRNVRVPPERSQFDDLRQRWRAEAADRAADPFHVLAHVGRDLFRHDWNSCLSDRWTDPEGHVFSGLIYRTGPDDRLAAPPRRGRLMVVTALGAGIRDGDRIIPMIDVAVGQTAGSFRASGFKVVAKQRDATRDDFTAALTGSDIVVVCAHAGRGSFRFPDGDFGADEWRQLGDTVRCRCMLILGCELGDLVSSSDPLLLEVVSRGVTCVASTRRQDALLGQALMSAFCKAWRSGRGAGPTMARALRDATARVAGATDPAWGDKWEDDLNAYTIIGTPTLHLAWRWAGWRLWR
jgi:hypothetical protein